MLQIRRSEDRGYFDHGWLKTYHTFSFGEYDDPQFRGFKTLRVINEDRIEGGTGFQTHGHRDMEIISYVLKGALRHKDTLGNETTIHPGEVQRMSAGTGIRHSEFNQLDHEQAHFMQIWILPEKNGLEPSYDQKDFSSRIKDNELLLLCSPTGEAGSVHIHQQAWMAVARLRAGSLKVAPRAGLSIWIQVAAGEVNAAGRRLSAGDSAFGEQTDPLELSASDFAEVLIFHV